VIIKTIINTPLGEMLARSHLFEKNTAKISGLWFIEQKHFPENHTQWEKKDTHPIFKELKIWLDSYFNKEKNIPVIPVFLQGSDFQLNVWDKLQKIPYGNTVTYLDIAKKVFTSDSICAQAVGTAVGKNPISIIIPCHRVLGTDGKLHGYAGGIDRKIALLKLEQFDTLKP
jgi:methylated-DNA-[protein]-cysteine S-methyltransferase